MRSVLIFLLFVLNADDILSQGPSIHKIDFGNFTYPKTKELEGLPGATFRLKNGILREGRDSSGNVTRVGVGLSKVIYGDVTGDGTDDAIVTLGVMTWGSGMPSCVYIYSMSNNRPKLLWSFDTGDRGDGGLRKILAKNGLIIIELYGKGKTIGGNLYASDGTGRGACCPSHYTRASYKWDVNRFRLMEKPVILPVP